MLWWKLMFNMLKGVLGIATFSYSGATPTSLIDPRTGLPTVGIPTYSSITLAEAAFPAASNPYQPFLHTGIHETGVTGGSYWHSNGVVYVPMGIPRMTYAAALALCNGNASGYSGTKFSLSDQNNAIHYFDGTNLVPANGSCRIAHSAVKQKFVAPQVSAGVVVSCTLISGTIYELTFNANHGLTTAVAVGAYLVVKSDGNNFTLGQKLLLTSVTDADKIVRVDIGSGATPSGVPVICHVADEFVMQILSVPPLHANSGVDVNYELSCNPRVGNKSTFMRFNSTSSNAFESNGMTTNYGIVCRLGLRNRNSLTSQVATHGYSSSYGPGIQTAGLPITSAVDTTNATTMYITGIFATTVNEILALEFYDMWKVG